jgi:hypothetical protein
MTWQGVLKKALMKMSKRAMAGAFINWAESVEEAGAYSRPLFSST